MVRLARGWVDVRRISDGLLIRIVITFSPCTCFGGVILGIYYQLIDTVMTIPTTVVLIINGDKNGHAAAMGVSYENVREDSCFDY